MTIKEFEYKVNKLIYDVSAIQINELIGTSKTSTASIGLYLNVPIKVKARKTDKKLETSKKAINNTIAYLNHEDQNTIQFAFFYNDEKKLKSLYKSIEKHSYYMTYMYLRELFRLMRNHNTLAHYNMMKRVIKTTKSVDPTTYYSYILIASDYAINNYLYDLYARTNAPYAEKVLSNIVKYENFNKNFKDMDDIQILVEVLNTSTVVPVILDNDIHLDKNSDTMYLVDNKLKDNDDIIVDLGESISNHLRSASRGLGSSQIFESAILASKVKTGWFKKLNKNITRTVHYMTENSYSSWSNYNIVYKHKFKSPKHVHQKNALNIYISVDQSGSMSDDDLGKLLYIVKKHATKINKIVVWIHDSEIVKEFTLTESSGELSVTDITKVFGNRVACGGTSHKCIADKLYSLNLDADKNIYISFSDNYSDIPQAWKQYKSLSKIPTYWVCTVNNPVPSQVGGTNITLE